MPEPTLPSHRPALDLSDEAGWPTALNNTHRRYLSTRGVSPAVAAARGYLSVTAREGAGANDLGSYGWGKSHKLRGTIDRRTGDAVMIIPLYHAHRSEPSTYQARADKPRMSDGTRPRPLKFEAPFGRKRGLEHGDIPADVNPLRHHEATSSSWPLILTEGIPKADAILTAAIAEGVEVVPVALTGVTMGYEAEASKTHQGEVERILADMIVALASGRERVYLCWDSDWAIKPMVRNSLLRTGQLLTEAGVEEVIYIGIPGPGPDSDPDDKTGVDDWLAGGGLLAELLSEHQMDPPALPGEASLVDLDVESFKVNTEQLVMWDWVNKRVEDAAKPVPVRTVKFGAVAEILEVVQQQKIVTYELETKSDTYFVLVEWVEKHPLGRRRRSKVIEVPAEEFPELSKWISRDGELGRILVPSRGDERIALNTIRERSIPTTSIQATTTGWYRHTKDEAAIGGGQEGWRFIHGEGWIGHDIHGDGIDCSASDSNVRFSNVSPGDDIDKANEAFANWVSDWVNGQAPDRLAAEDPHRFGPQTKADHSNLADLEVRLAVGAIAVARAIIPGRPMKGTLYLVGPPGTGKTFLAKLWTSAFGDHFAETPFGSLGESTQAGIEVALADARQMLVVLDDFKPSDRASVIRMSSIVDQVARSASDGARKDRSTRTLESMKAPEMEASVIFTGEELPAQTAASNSTIQRLLVVPCRDNTAPVYEIMAHLSVEAADRSQLAVGAIINQVAGYLDRSLGGAGRSSVSAVDALRNELADWARSMSLDVRMMAETSVVDRPTERTAKAMADFMLGAALILKVAKDLGVVDTPAEFSALQDKLTAAGAWLMAETAKVVSDTSPGRNIADQIRSAIGSGRAYLTTADGSCPPGADAQFWGWVPRAGGDWQPGRESVGWVITHEGELVVALNPQVTCLVLGQLGERGEFTTSRLKRMLQDARDDDGEPVLAHPTRPVVTRVRINGSRQGCILLRPEALSIPVNWVAHDPQPVTDGSDGPGEDF